MRRLPIIVVLLALAIIASACGDDQPPTVVYVVFSPTPDPATAEVLTATADAALTATNEALSSPTATQAPPSATPTLTSADTVQPSSGTATVTNTPAMPPSAVPTQPPADAPTTAPIEPTSLPDIYPTNTAGQVQLAEQVFEGGRMFWIRFNRQIWVMIEGDVPRQGDWFCYFDTFEEGEPEIDPDIVPPADHYQPRRGFGKLWRNLAEIRDKLGWALTPEFELTSDYTYIPGGYVEDGVYYPGPGEHRLNTLYNEPVSFYETEIRGDCQGGTWRMPPSQ